MNRRLCIGYGILSIDPLKNIKHALKVALTGAISLLQEVRSSREDYRAEEHIRISLVFCSPASKAYDTLMPSTSRHEDLGLNQRKKAIQQLQF
ncbi:hypothetical protein NDU88_004096 [Pleurodeles waltl]|uniref:Uncharacterized protein n=1 Tax=Pleurodeles waltl TaxID=8319 RepID=A0AAV7WWQ1_PLEWA|nr:hypothetical protein NDU88_004096 [Pleurodeles waltl]